MPVALPSEGIARTIGPAEAAKDLCHRDKRLVVLLSSARAGNADAWNRLVQHFDGTLRNVARSYRLGHAMLTTSFRRHGSTCSRRSTRSATLRLSAPG